MLELSRVRFVILIMACLIARLPSASASYPACSQIHAPTSLQLLLPSEGFKSPALSGLKLVEFDSTRDKKATIQFISQIRQKMGVHPFFTADHRPLFSDLKNPELSYKNGLGELFLLKNEEGKIQGTIGFTMISPGSCELKKVYLHPDLRGFGLGRGLLEKVILRAKSLGFREMILQTNPVMNKAIEVYLKAGFRPFDSQSAATNARYYSLQLAP